ncbi:MAG TPA: type I methionyl aminopeptidase [Dehalococcoidales bacterium]|nr:type I methionyl aminopeptidase [Dehalococcoidales bacterium]
MVISIKSEREIALMRQAGSIVAEVLEMLVAHLQPGLKTKELDFLAEKEIRKLGAEPSFKGYHGYPASLCVSINEEIVHGIPGERVLKDGDIVTLDLGAIYREYQGDAARTVGVGSFSLKARELILATEGAFSAGIKMARAGNHMGDISAAVQQFGEARGFSIVREYGGHGIGRKMHEDPHIPNFGVPGSGPLLKKGMTLAIEPMLTTGDWRTKVGQNQWTVSTVDGSLSAHYENTIVITEKEPEILTVRKVVKNICVNTGEYGQERGYRS